MSSEDQNVINARIIARLDALEKAVVKLQALDELVGDIRVTLGKLEMQTKITWGLLVMVVGGLVSVAFSLWSVP